MSNLVGTGLNQVPTNGMLGGLAYQDPEHASIKNLDLKNLSQINSEIANTAVDVFVYDTRKDSDGGAWRKRTQHTSWYNETLNTATRGSRKEFPAVAVIVVDSTFDLTIYDGDDPDLPMWMKFENSGFLSWSTGGDCEIKTVSMLNGIFVTGGDDGDGGIHVNFVSDHIRTIFGNGNKYDFTVASPIISNRSAVVSFIANSAGDGIAIVNTNINDVAMTVLPNAPIDSATGLPIPTIAVATNGGLSIIKDDGIVSNPLSGTHIGSTIDISDDFVLYYGNESQGGYYPYDVKTATYISNARFFSVSLDGPLCLLNNISNSTNQDIAFTGDDGQSLAIGMDDGLNLINGDPRNGIADNGMVAYATTSYNTGWMQGDIKGAFLSDTDTTNVTGTELVTNGDFSNGTTGWSASSNSTTLSVSNNQLTISSNSGDYGVAYRQITLTAGKTYVLSINIVSSNSLNYTRVGYLSSYDGTSSSNTNLITNGTAVYGVNTRTFTPTTSGQYDFTIGGRDDVNSLVVSDVSIREADPDRSVNSKGLQVLGTITKTPVATGADLVGYSGWSASNWLMRPITTDDIPTSAGWSLSLWIKTSNSSLTNQVIWSIRDSANSSIWLQFWFTGSTDINFGQESGTRAASSVGYADGQWHCYTGTKSSTTIALYKDGVLLNSVANTSVSSIPSTAQFRIGQHHDGQYPVDGSIALLRYSRSAPSSAQVKKMYEDEKVLFQENAKATLYGSSNAVTALAFDDTTELLHVGTSAGRSEFQGLRRINNTTTAVTTAISASNDLVAEQ